MIFVLKWRLPPHLTPFNNTSKINTDTSGESLGNQWDESKFERYKQNFCLVCVSFAQ